MLCPTLVKINKLKKIYIFFYHQEIYCLEPEKSDEGSLEAISRRNVPASKFGALLAERRAADVRAGRTAAPLAPDHGARGNYAITQVQFFLYSIYR